MNYPFSLAWRNLRTRPIQTTLTVLVVGLALALFVAISVLGDAIRQGVIRASDPFGVLVVGAKGSGQQLVLSSILLQGQPVGNIPYAIFERLAADERVATAVPLAFGDNVGGAKIIGTNEAFFALTGPRNEPSPFVVVEGRLFAEPFEAVLGSGAARQLGLQVGQTFRSSHGVERGFEPNEHDAPFTVVGILGATGTPYDAAVFTSVESVWLVHEEGHDHEAHDNHDHDDHDHDDHDHDDHDHAQGDEHNHEDDGSAFRDQVTAVLVKPSNPAVAYPLWQEFYIGTEAQAAFPGQELGGLFDQLRLGEQVLTAVGYLAAVMAGLTIFLALYSSTIAQEQQVAIMRSLGAKRGVVVQMIVWEAVLVALLGGVLGRLVGFGGAWLIGQQVAAQTAVPVLVRWQWGLEPFLWLLPLGLAAVGGLYPALLAYRVNVVEKLFPS